MSLSLSIYQNSPDHEVMAVAHMPIEIIDQQKGTVKLTIAVCHSCKVFWDSLPGAYSAYFDITAGFSRVLGKTRTDRYLLQLYFQMECFFATMKRMKGYSRRHSPLVVAFVKNLMLTTKIENVAQQLDYQVVMIGAATELSADTSQKSQNQPGEPIHGREGQLVSRITLWQPALMIFNLDNGAIPWREWIALLRSSPATRRFPILCFGPHMDTESLDEAKRLGADVVIARSRFVSDLPKLLENHSRIYDFDLISEACNEPASTLALRGLEEFNQGNYFDSHEHLEDAWNQDQGEAREAYRAVLQIAVAYLQIERQNYSGAVKMFLRARQWLEPLPDVCRGIDIAQLRIDAQCVYQALLKLGPGRLNEFDRTLFRPIRFTGEVSRKV